MRTIIELPDHQVSALAELCAREGISRAEAIRRALESMLKERQLARRDDVFGAWSARGDSRALVDELRDEWTR